MPNEFLFELPGVLLAGIPLLAAALVLSATLLRRRGVSRRRRAFLLALRGLGLWLLILLVARPVAVEREDPKARRTVALLLDASKSMALRERGASRFDRLLDLTESRLVPALAAEGWEVDPYFFAGGVQAAPANRLRDAIADGETTDLGAAIAGVLRSSAIPPLAVVALTDGAANAASHNRSALVELIETTTPFVGIGIGDDEGVASLDLDRVTGPSRVPPEEEFRLAVHLQAVGSGEVPAFDLVLLRDGEMREVRRVAASRGSRLWTETFKLREEETGTREYTVELQAPTTPRLVTVSRTASTPVRISEDDELRILFVQGALTWNYKFIGRALRDDPSLRLTGLSRTSEQSIFRQNVESSDELLDGFPADLKELAPFRVVVLSELRPVDLTLGQQETLARFVGELGGGLLMIGGASTFDGSWQSSRLERLLPVTFDPHPGVLLDRPFHLELTAAARRHPVFQLVDGGSGSPSSDAVWESLPTFTRYGRVLEAKSGATVWARHDTDAGPEGRRILIASQPYGAGISAVIAIQNLWRWRLARDVDPAHFDRYWRQLFRYLSQSGSQDISVQFLESDRSPGAEITALVERRPRPEAENPASGAAFVIRVAGPHRQTLLEQRAELEPLRPVQIGFRAEREGVYRVTVSDTDDVVRVSQPLEIKTIDREMERTGRDMENLRQWANVSRGLAVPLEECDHLDSLMERIKERIEEMQRIRERRRPLGLGGWVMAVLLVLLCGEWALRKRWNLA